MRKSRYKLRAYKGHEPSYSEGHEALQKRESSVVLFHGITVYESLSQLQTIRLSPLEHMGCSQAGASSISARDVRPCATLVSLVMTAAAILGGGITAGTHFTKAGSRAVINSSPEPFSNALASLGEDVIVPTGLWLALAHPALFIALLAVFLLLAVLLLRLILRGIGLLATRLRSKPVTGG